MRVLACILLDGLRCAAVRVAFTQYRIDRAADALAEAGFQRLVGVGLWIFRVVRQLVAMALQFFDASHQLGDRGADVRQLDDVGVRQLGQGAQFGQGIRYFLFVGQEFAELGQHARCYRNVTADHVYTSLRGELLDYRQQGVSRQQRRFVSERVDNFRFLCCHGHFLICSHIARWVIRHIVVYLAGRPSCWR
jgi:hypothetical protein